MIELKKDLIVIGAGPAGSSAAFLAARAGLDVLILEKESWPRYKACGGALSAKTVDILSEHDIQIGPELIKNQISEFKFSFPGREEFGLNYKKTPIKLINRKTFDDFLLKKAAAAGAEFIDQMEVLRVKENGNEVLVETLTENYTSQFLVAADGANSRTAKYLNREKKGIIKNKGIAIEAEIEYQNLIDNNFKDQILIDFKHLDNGYGWVFPKKDFLSIGLGILNFEKVDLNKILAEYLRELNIRIKKDDFLVKGHPIPVYSDQTEFKRASNRIFLAGDAAYLADAFIGEGIYYSLVSGFAAAETIVDYLDSNSAEPNYIPAENYEFKLKNNIFTELKEAEKIARLFYNNKKIVQLLLKSRRDLLIIFMDAVQGLKSYSELGNLFNFFKNLFKIKI